MVNKDEIEPKLMEKLSTLEAVPPRNPERAAQARVAFIDQARELSATVTADGKRRHKGRMQVIRPNFMMNRKEKASMFNALATIALIVSLVLGGGGVTVAAAQTSLPDQPLYGVKVVSEDVRLFFAVNPQPQYELALDFASRRAEEIQALLPAAGDMSLESVEFRYQEQIEQAIRSAMNLPDDQAVQALEQIRTRLETQQQTFAQLQVNASQSENAFLLQTQQMVQERLQWVETGLEDPAQLRMRLQQQTQNQQSVQATQETVETTEESVLEADGNPWTTGTPTPYSGYGPGPGTGECGDCTPVSDGQGGNNPWTTGTPTPYSSYGPGPGTSLSSTPSGDSSGEPQNQQQNNQPTWAEPQPTQGSQQGTNSGGQGNHP